MPDTDTTSLPKIVARAIDRDSAPVFSWRSCLVRVNRRLELGTEVVWAREDLPQPMPTLCAEALYKYLSRQTGRFVVPTPLPKGFVALGSYEWLGDLLERRSFGELDGESMAFDLLEAMEVFQRVSGGATHHARLVLDMPIARSHFGRFVIAPGKVSLGLGAFEEAGSRARSSRDTTELGAIMLLGLLARADPARALELELERRRSREGFLRQLPSVARAALQGPETARVRGLRKAAEALLDERQVLVESAWTRLKSSAEGRQRAKESAWYRAVARSGGPDLREALGRFPGPPASGHWWLVAAAAAARRGLLLDGGEGEAATEDLRVLDELLAGATSYPLDIWLRARVRERLDQGDAGSPSFLRGVDELLREVGARRADPFLALCVLLALQDTTALPLDRRQAAATAAQRLVAGEIVLEPPAKLADLANELRALPGQLLRAELSRLTA